MKRNRLPPNQHRAGAIAVIALIAILITISIGMSLVKTTLLERQETFKLQDQKQSEWLVEAGIERAVARLEASADYRGETWTLSAEELGGRDGGEVTIRIEDSAEENGRKQLTVIADYPAGDEQRIRSRKHITIRN